VDTNLKSQVPAVPRRAPRVLTYRLASILALLFPFTGIPALMASLRASRLHREGRLEDAREQGERARDFCWYSLGYGLLAYFIVFIVLLFTARHNALFKTYFDDVILTRTAWKSLLKGFWINIQLFMWAGAIVLVWALVVALLRLLPGKACGPIRFVAAAYTDIFRSVPAILVIFIINFGFQKARLPILENFSQMQFGILALVLVYGAYVSEVYRAGIESIHWSQVAAARSLGLSYGQTMRHVVVPQAVRRVIPPLLNDFIGMQKDTALVGFIGLNELLQRARFLNNNKATFTGYTIATMLFIVITIPMTRFTDRMMKRDQARMRVG
jgi:polar amino acid transport system permease protein